jgi:hypothetical protein
VQFDVVFASQAGAGPYTVVLGPDIRDLANNAMNQNQNTVNGEVPGDRFTATVTLMASCAADVTNQLSIVRGGFRRNSITGRYVQLVTIRNVTQAPLSGPIALAIDGLVASATLFAPAGITQCSLPAGSPFVNVNVGSDGILGVSESATITLEFTNPSNQPISFTPRALAGADR